jgi:DNA replication initiation complex subunit (GINS family)
MITYNDLYEALRKERYSEELQLLARDFFEQVAEYFKDKKEFAEKEKGEDLFADLALKNKKKLENAIAIFKELMLRRRKKILSMAFVASETGISKRDFDNLSGFEKELFDDVVQSLKKAEKSLDELRQGKVHVKTHSLIRFLEKVESFMGLDGNSLGPFEKGDISNLEKEIAEILVQDKKAEILEE